VTVQKLYQESKSIRTIYPTNKVNTSNNLNIIKNYMSSKTPYEIRLELIQEARLILQAKANKPEYMPTAEEVIEEAEKLNKFVSKRPE
jgi:hypothetical protein